MTFDVQLCNVTGTTKKSSAVNSNHRVFLTSCLSIKSELFTRFSGFAAIPSLSTILREWAIGRLQASDRARNIAIDLNVHISFIYRLQERFRGRVSVSDRPRPGQPRVTTARQDRRICRQHLRDRFQSARGTARETVGTLGRPISDRTVRRRLGQRNLKIGVPRR